jgi:hypothetical protein
MRFRRLLLGLLLLLTCVAVAPHAAAQARQYDQTQNPIEGAKRGAIGGAVKGAIGGAVAGAVSGAIGAIQRLRAKPGRDEERNLKEPGRPYF